MISLFFQIMLECWNRDPMKRPTFEFLTHMFEDFSITTQNQYMEQKHSSNVYNDNVVSLSSTTSMDLISKQKQLNTKFTKTNILKCHILLSYFSIVNERAQEEVRRRKKDIIMRASKSQPKVMNCDYKICFFVAYLCR